MTIDTRQIERVRDRIAQYMADETSCLMEQYINAEDLKLASKVLAAYAATLPREVEVVRWGVIEADGTWVCSHPRQEAAERFISASLPLCREPGRQVVRLTGTAVIKPEV